MPVYNPPIPGVIEEENYPEVNVHADLPDAAENEGVVYLVHTGTGIFGLGRKRAGMWRSNGSEWKRLGELGGSGGVIYSTPSTDKTVVRNIVMDEDNKEIVLVT